MNEQQKRLMEKCFDGRYILKKNIGQGGMGSVYKVLCTEDRTVYAAKIIENKEQGNSDEEARILLRLNHPMLPGIKEYFTYDTFTVIVMDYIEGSNLENYVKNNGPMSQKTAIIVLRQIMDVLMYLHSQEPPVIYRDLKPANIMADKKMRLHLIDFGTARRYKTENNNDTIALGTPGYAAPEQLMGCGQSDTRTDIYSLGATIYYLVTGIDIGKPPFEAMPVNTVRGGISAGFADIIEKCLQKNPRKRYQSISEMIRELDMVEYKSKSIEKNTTKAVNIVITHSNKNIMF